MSKKDQALLALVIGLVASAVAQSVLSKEATVLGLSAFEIALLGAISTAVVRRAA